jgi:hypothetical protein
VFRPTLPGEGDGGDDQQEKERAEDPRTVLRPTTE